MLLQFLLPFVLVLGATYYLFFSKKPNKKSKDFNLADYSDLLAERLAKFKPEPLTSPLTETEKKVIESIPLVDSKPLTKIDIIDKETKQRKSLLNFATTDFLGFGTAKTTEDVARDALNYYGCGSCGPRGFYGTFDVHLKLEEVIAKFLGTKSCIVYSDSYTTAPSVIAAFSSRTDYLVVDEACNDAIVNGCHLSRANVHFFRHLDMGHCEEILKDIEKKLEGKKNVETIRVIMITEAVFRTTGKVCDLNGFVRLRNKYKYRLFLDESLSIGILGKTGRGLAEQAGVDRKNIDFLIGSLDSAIGSIGGFCAGSESVVEHQRLMGAGYCFSAAVAPFLSATAVHVFEELEKSSEHVERLQKVLSYFHSKFKGTKWEVISDGKSAMCHIAPKSTMDLFEVVKILENKGIFVVRAIQTPRETELVEKGCLKESLRLAFNANHSESDVDELIAALKSIDSSQ